MILQINKSRAIIKTGAWFFLLTGFLFFYPLETHGQYSSDSKRAIRLFESAANSFNERNDEEAEEILLKVIRIDPEFLEAYRMLAQINLDRGERSTAIDYFSRSLEIDPEGNPDGFRILAGLTFNEGQYSRSLELINKFLSFSPEEVSRYDEGIRIKKSCLFALHAIAHPVPFHPVNLGDSINSEYYEYWPVLSVDEKVLYFTVLEPRNPEKQWTLSNLQEDFYYARRVESNGRGVIAGDTLPVWRSRVNLGKPLNTEDNEGAQSITADGMYLYFTACNRRDGKGQCDLYYSHLKEGSWTRPLNLGVPVNSVYSEKHPSISADGRTLFFSSDRPGGKGGFDIWKSEFIQGKWTKPVNLGDSVNTPGLEQSPFIHPDQQTLYFSSTGWTGMGNGDLFITHWRNDTSWTSPKNLGYPINTHNDEVGLTVNASGDRAYFASNRLSGKDLDIYTFKLPRDIRPTMVSYMTGRVYDSRTMKGLEALIQLIDLETEEVVMELQSSSGEGSFLVSLPTNRDYALNVSREGYLFYSGHFSFTGEHKRTDPFRKNVPLDPIQVGSSVVLNNIFFETDAYSLLPESIVELKKVVEFLNNNPTLKIEISGHTDNTGTESYNLDLSNKRAGAVVDYLVKAGIDEERLSSSGYGDTEPVADNNTEDGRAQNRRTELSVIAIH